LPYSAAGLIQVKFTDGVFVGLFAVLAAGCSGTAPVRRFAEVSVAFGAALLLGWTLAGQSLADLWPWFTASLQISLGYSDALTSEMPLHTLPYILAALLAVVVIALGGAVDSGVGVPAAPQAWLAIMLAALYIGFKEGFIRHEPYPPGAYFSACVPLLAVLVTAARHRSTGRGLAVDRAGVRRKTASPGSTRSRRLAGGAQRRSLLLDAHYRNGLLNAEATRAAQRLRHTAGHARAVGEHPVAVDPWEARWHGRTRCTTTRSDVSDLQRVHEIARRAQRQGAARRPERPEGIAPAAELLASAISCGVAAVHPHTGLPVLGRVGESALDAAAEARNRCGRATTIDTEHVRAGQVISSGSGSESDRVGSVHPGGERVGNAVVNLLWKDVHRLYVTTDGVRHVLARRLASAP